MRYHLEKNEKILITAYFKYNYYLIILIGLFSVVLISIIETLLISGNFNIQNYYYVILGFLIFIWLILLSYLPIKNQELVLTNKKIFIVKQKRFIILYPKIDTLSIRKSIWGNNLTIRVGKYTITLRGIDNIKEIEKLIYQKI